MKDDDKGIWYMNETAINGWSYDILGFQIKSDLYLRYVLGDKPNNFILTLIRFNYGNLMSQKKCEDSKIGIPQKGEKYELL